jgi:hypothetical protein
MCKHGEHEIIGGEKWSHGVFNLIQSKTDFFRLDFNIAYDTLKAGDTVEM